MWCAVILCIMLLNLAVTSASLLDCSRRKRDINDEDDEDNEKTKNKRRVEPSIRIKVDPIPLDTEDAEEMKSSSKSKKSDSKREWERRLKKVEEELQHAHNKKALQANTITTAREPSTTIKDRDSVNLSVHIPVPTSTDGTIDSQKTSSEVQQLTADKSARNEKGSKKLSAFTKIRSRISQSERAKTAKTTAEQQKATSKTSKLTALRSFITKHKEAVTVKRVTADCNQNERLQSKQALTTKTAKEIEKQKSESLSGPAIKTDAEQMSINYKENLRTARELHQLSNGTSSKKTDKPETPVGGKKQKDGPKVFPSQVPHYPEKQRQHATRTTSPNLKNMLKHKHKHRGEKRRHMAPKASKKIIRLTDDDSCANASTAVTAKSAATPLSGMPSLKGVSTPKIAGNQLEPKTASTPPSVRTPQPRPKRGGEGSRRSSQRLKLKTLGLRLKHAIADETATEDSSSSGRTIGDDNVTPSVHDEQNSSYFIAGFFH